MTWRIRLLALAAAVHLLLVMASAAHMQLAPRRSPLARTIASYGALSGSDNTFGFFAPRVAPRFQLTMTITGDGGHTWQETAMDQGQTREAQLRLNSATSLFGFDALQPRLGRTWAAAMFGRYENAVSVELSVEAEDTPTMEAFRDGVRSEWQPVYSEEFFRRGGDDQMASN